MYMKEVKNYLICSMLYEYLLSLGIINILITQFLFTAILVRVVAFMSNITVLLG